MTGAPAVTVTVADYARDFSDLRAVREAVFIREQRVPAALELDAADPDCIHVVARDATGHAIGTGRLVPPEPTKNGTGPDALPAARIGRMAVLPAWRGRDVGHAMLLALLAAARAQGWPRVVLHAQASAIGFYQRHGFLPVGPRFVEAGIEHLTMWRPVDGVMAVRDAPGAVAVVVALAASARRTLRIRSHDLDPGILDVPDAIEALRRFATGRTQAGVRILLHSAAAAQRLQSPLIPLAQRLPSLFAFRETVDPVDRDDASAFVVDDGGGSWYRGVGRRMDGEVRLQAQARARQLRERFDRAWERSRPVTEYRVLGA